MYAGFIVPCGFPPIAVWRVSLADDRAHFLSLWPKWEISYVAEMSGKLSYGLVQKVVAGHPDGSQNVK